MESIIERITRQHFWQFHGGIHPPEQKTLSNTKPIRQLSLPKQLIIPLQQHIGRQGDLLVKTGDTVLKGQALTQSLNPMAVPIHAPTSGTISAIKKSTIAHPSGLSEICLFLQTDGEDRWKKREICQDFRQLEQHTIVQKIADAGIAGMGGAGFPTHIKVNVKPEINFLIINAAECEPYITSDDLLIREQSEAIIDGINILDHLLAPAFILIGIENNKPEAAQALINASKHNDKIKVCILPTLYPSGGEKQLIKILTGKEIPSGSLPIHSGIVMQNIATCFAIADAVINDIPLIRRVVTVTGQAINKPQNVWALLGTPVEFLLKQCGFSTKAPAHASNDITSSPLPLSLPLIMGGPMMGFSLNNDQVPIVKTSNCILAPSEREMPSAFASKSQEVECIRCGQCSDVCPSQLLPQELQWSAKAKDYQQLKKLNLQDCIDCGACAYVCPSQIPLVQYYRVAKAEIRQQQFLDVKAEQAKARFEARKLRLENEKTARELKHKQAAEARKAKLSKNPAEASDAKSAVAAALARVRAKKKAQADNAQVTSKAVEVTTVTIPATSTQPIDDKKAKIAAAIARAKAKKQAQALAQENALPNAEPVKQDVKAVNKLHSQKSTADNVQSNVEEANVKSTTVSKTPDNSEQVTTEDTAALAKKQRIITAVAKAKEKAKVKAKEKAKIKAAEQAKNRIKEQTAVQEKADIAKTSDKQHEST